jgi:hypothetical protein
MNTQCSESIIDCFFQKINESDGFFISGDLREVAHRKTVRRIFTWPIS